MYIIFDTEKNDVLPKTKTPLPGVINSKVKQLNDKVGKMRYVVRLLTNNRCKQ